MCPRPWSKPIHLSLDELRADPNLARLLPPEVAYRFHALPVAEQGGRITVVMADPEDGEALSAIASLLGCEPCVVQGDRETIDASLARIWGRALPDALKLLMCTDGRPPAGSLGAYARSLGQLLHAEVEHTSCGGGLETLAGQPGEPVADLLLIGEAGSPAIRSWLAAGDSRRRLPAALLVAHRPRWPLARILLIVRAEESDDAAADWVLRLAVPAGSAVSVLAVVPPLATLHGGRRPTTMERAWNRQGLPALLSTGTPLGHELQRVVRQLEEQGIRSSLRLRQGPPEWQIRRELADEDHDLVVMALQLGKEGQSESGNLAAALLSWSERPMLIARPGSR